MPRKSYKPEGEIFHSLREAEIVIESWRRHYNTVRPHASIGYRAPAPEVFVPALAAWPAAPPRPAPPAMLKLAPQSTLNYIQAEPPSGANQRAREESNP